MESVLFCIMFNIIPAEVYGLLYQVNSPEVYCPSDQLTFICTSTDDVRLVEWTIITTSGIRTSFAFHLQFDLVGREMITELEGTEVRVELVFKNSSNSITSLNIAAALSSTIRCNHDEIFYTYSGSPQQIFFQPSLNDSISNYTVLWEPHSHYKYYNVTLTSVSKSSALSTAAIYENQSFSLVLINDWLYAVTISFNKCPEEVVSTFVFECSLNVPEDYFLIYFKGHINGTWSADVKCIYDQQMYKIHCANGTWEFYDNVCKLWTIDAGNSTKAYHYSAMDQVSSEYYATACQLSAHSGTKSSSVYNICISDSITVDKMEDNNAAYRLDFNVVVVTSSNTATCVLCLTIGVVLGGLLCRRRKRKITQVNNEQSNAAAPPASNSPIYEDIKLDDAPVRMTKNTAYEHV